MIEIVAFDFERQVLTYRDGRVIARAPYHQTWDDQYVFDPVLPTVRALAPDAPVYHLSDDRFISAVDRVAAWDYGFVLELARRG